MLGSSRKQVGTSSSMANRGLGWEKVIELMLGRYQAQGRAVYIRTPPPVSIIKSVGRGQFLSCFRSSGPPDYVICTPQTTFMAEAKECSQKRWPIENVKPHQAEHFDRLESIDAGHGLILLRHRPTHACFAILWRDLRPRWEAVMHARSTVGRAPQGTASLTPEDMAELAVSVGRDCVDFLDDVHSATAHGRTGLGEG